MENQEPVRDASSLGKPKMLILGLQHMFAMFGATVVVPLIVSSYGLPLSVQTTLMMAGLGTLLFHWFSKFQVPAFLGSSFAFLAGFEAVAALNSGIYAGMSGAEKLQYACGGVVVAGLLYVVLALIIKFVGVKKVMRLFPPIVTGPIIILIGLNLAPNAAADASTCWPIALCAIAIIVIANIWGKGMIKIVPILLGVVGAYLIAVVADLCGAELVDFSSVKAAKWFGLPQFFTNMKGSVAKFDITSILVMAPIAIAAMMEHVGDVSAISATVGKNFVEEPGLHRTLMGDGLATSLSAMFGGPANTTYGENTGVLVLSRVYDPKVVRIAAFYAIILSFSPKFAELIYAMPTAVIGGTSFILYGMISAIGVRNVVENRVDFSQSRNLIIGAIILVCGLGLKNGITFKIGETAIKLTNLAIAAIAGILLNAILPGNDYEFGADISEGRSGDFGRY